MKDVLRKASKVQIGDWVVVNNSTCGRERVTDIEDLGDRVCLCFFATGFGTPGFVKVFSKKTNVKVTVEII